MKDEGTVSVPQSHSHVTPLATVSTTTHLFGFSKEVCGGGGGGTEVSLSQGGFKMQQSLDH